MDKKELRKRFIDKLNKDDKSYPDTNAGFRKFLKDLGVKPFNYKDGGLVKPRANGHLPMDKKILRTFEKTREKQLLRSGKPKIAKRGY